MKVNEKVRILRESNNWSQQQLADKLDMSTNGYAKIERGESSLTIAKLEQIAEVFGVDILELMSLGENNILLFQEKDNVSFINSSQELASEIRNLKQTIQHKDELLEQQKKMLADKEREINTLNEFIQTLKSK